MTLQKILNWVIGVRFETKNNLSPEKVLHDLCEYKNPVTCPKTDCLNYGIYRSCYESKYGCKDYVRFEE